MAKTPWKLSHSVLGLVTMPSKVRAEWDTDYDRDAPCTGSASTQRYSRSAVRSRQCGYSLLATCLAFAVAH